MTKAEAFIYNSTLWECTERGRKMDHKSHADVPCNVYLRAVDEGTGLNITHRLVCYSFYGDSILWTWDERTDSWRSPRDIEATYDTSLRSLV